MEWICENASLKILQTIIIRTKTNDEKKNKCHLIPSNDLSAFMILQSIASEIVAYEIPDEI